MKRMLLIFPILFFFMPPCPGEPKLASVAVPACASPVSPVSPKIPVVAGGAKTEALDEGFDLPVQQWPGKRFYILPKQKILQHFGYELYRTPELGQSAEKIDPDVETSQRHARCDKFGNSTIVVLKIKPVGNEFLVTFSHDKTGVLLYAKTRRGAIEGIALAHDIDKAKERWLGKTVYSARRFIDVYDTVLGKLSTKKTGIGDSLKVIDITWGQTPLPPKPLWLVVRTPKNEKGFIPVCVSRANVLLDKITSARPWDDDVLEQNPKVLYTWDSVIWEAINNHSIASGMTGAQVRMSWGPPQAITDENIAGAAGQRWRYENGQILHFVHDSLVSPEGR